MAYLLDTNVLSELCKPASDPRVQTWVLAQPAHELFICSITVSEIERGLVRMPAGKRKSQVQAWWTDLVERVYANRILPFDGAAAAMCGRTLGALDAAGTPLPWPDAMIAAIASVAGLTVATRDVADFQRLGVAVFNPWID